ncbi:MAG: sulfite exporter TauE/SafE family protein [Kofleriaceae bacterium]
MLSIAIGLSLGLLGGGGSILTVPVLHYILGLEAHEAIATSLIVVGLTSAVAMIPYARAHDVRWRVGLVFGAASMSAAFAGARLGAAIPGALLIGGFAALMIASGTTMIVRARRSPPGVPLAARELELGRTILIGLAAGLLTGVLGAGGGFVIVPALVIAAGLPMRQAIGTSLLVIALNSAAAFAGALGHTDIDGAIAIPIVLIAIAGSLLGGWLGRRVSARGLQRGFGVLVVVVGLAIALRELV